MIVGSRSRAGPTTSGTRWRARWSSTIRRWRRSRRARRAIDEVETLVAGWTRTRVRLDIAEQLQAAGIEAVPVEDFGDLHDDPQLANRSHFEPHHHEFLGDGLYERNGFRLRESPSGYDRAGPTLGQDTDWVLTDVLGLDADEITGLRASGAVE